MNGEQLANLLLRNPKAEVLIGIHESGCSILKVEKGTARANKNIIIIWVDDVQDYFLSDVRLEKLK